MRNKFTVVAAIITYWLKNGEYLVNMHTSKLYYIYFLDGVLLWCRTYAEIHFLMIFFKILTMYFFKLNIIVKKCYMVLENTIVFYIIFHFYFYRRCLAVKLYPHNLRLIYTNKFLLRCFNNRENKSVSGVF